MPCISLSRTPLCRLVFRQKDEYELGHRHGQCLPRRQRTRYREPVGLGAAPRTVRVAASEDGKDSEESKRVQDTLEQILNLQVGQARLKGKVEEASGTLEAAAEQVKDEIDRARETSREKSEESFLEAMEKIDRLAQEATENLESSTVFNSGQDEDELEAWETRMEQERSAGQFFKRLYVDEKRKKKKSKSASTLTSEEMKEKAKEIRAEVNKELRNPFRLVVYGFLSTVLLIAALEDALTEFPAWGRIALYMTIAGFCAFNGYKEVQYLEEQSRDNNL
mmetsp:Transcript_7294/g.13187  ORF Transcript_7294/g.13187 Transcript_7294/m.13187 type:complete len:279 (-) Transcript_7294:77-913(-)